MAAGRTSVHGASQIKILFIVTNMYRGEIEELLHGVVRAIKIGLSREENIYIYICI